MNGLYPFNGPCSIGKAVKYYNIKRLGTIGTLGADNRKNIRIFVERYLVLSMRLSIFLKYINVDFNIDNVMDNTR